MKSAKLLFLAVSGILAFSSLKAQTADEIIAKHIEAIGGKENLSKITSLYTEGVMEIMGNEAPMTTYLVSGKGYRTEIDFQGNKIIQTYTDKGGWSVNPMMGSTEAQPMPEDQVKSSRGQLYVGGPLMDYAAKGNKVELLAKEGNDHRIKLTSADNIESTYFIDPNTYYITKVVAKSNMQGQDVEVTTTFSDHQKTESGLVVPHKLNIDTGQFQMSATVKKVEVNKTIDPQLFEMPKS